MGINYCKANDTVQLDNIFILRPYTVSQSL